MSEFCVYLEWAGWKPEVWAAWVQAIGSVLGIATAIAVPAWLFRQERTRRANEQAQRAKGYALFLLPMVRRLLRNVRHAEWRLSQNDAHFELDEISKLLSLPVELHQNSIVMHELGGIGSVLQDAIQGVSGLESLIDSHDFYLRHGGEYHDYETGAVDTLEEPPPYEPVMEKVRRQLSEAEREMTAMFE